jgi:transposase-like protein
MGLDGRIADPIAPIAPLITPPCPSCASLNLRLTDFSTVTKVVTYRCRACGKVWTDQAPTDRPG